MSCHTTMHVITHTWWGQSQSMLVKHNCTYEYIEAFIMVTYYINSIYLGERFKIITSLHRQNCFICSNHWYTILGMLNLYMKTIIPLNKNSPMLLMIWLSTGVCGGRVFLFQLSMWLATNKRKWMHYVAAAPLPVARYKVWPVWSWTGNVPGRIRLITSPGETLDSTALELLHSTMSGLIYLDHGCWWAVSTPGWGGGGLRSSKWKLLFCSAELTCSCAVPS